MSNEQRTVERFYWRHDGMSRMEDLEDSGDWVRFEDYERLEKNLKDLLDVSNWKTEQMAKLQDDKKALLALLLNSWPGMPTSLIQENSKLRADNKALRLNLTSTAADLKQAQEDGRKLEAEKEKHARAEPMSLEMAHSVVSQLPSDVVQYCMDTLSATDLEAIARLMREQP